MSITHYTRRSCGRFERQTDRSAKQSYTQDAQAIRGHSPIIRVVRGLNEIRKRPIRSLYVAYRFQQPDVKCRDPCSPLPTALGYLFPFGRGHRKDAGDSKYRLNITMPETLSPVDTAVEPIAPTPDTRRAQMRHVL